MCRTGCAILAGFCLAHAAHAPAARMDAVGIQMRNVNLRMERGIVLQVRSMRGQMRPTSDDRPVTLDDPNSFRVEMESGVMAITAATLTEILNGYVFAYEGAPLKKLSAEIKADRLVVKGTMHKSIDLPFELEGGLSPTADGNIRFHADKIKSEHIPFKGLLHLFGEDLAKLIHANGARGVRMEGDDILLFPSAMLPPPHIDGRVTAVRTEGENIVEAFGEGRPRAPMTLPERAANYIYHRGGTLRFGKLTMANADLEIIDQNPKTPFDFSLPDYNRQLTAGYSRNTPSHGLIVYMPDYAQIGQKRAAGRKRR